MWAWEKQNVANNAVPRWPADLALRRWIINELASFLQIVYLGSRLTYPEMNLFVLLSVSQSRAGISALRHLWVTEWALCGRQCDTWFKGAQSSTKYRRTNASAASLPHQRISLTQSPCSLLSRERAEWAVITLIAAGPNPRLWGEREGKLWMWPWRVVIVKLRKSCWSRILTCSAAFQFWSKGPPEQQLITQSIHSFCFSLNDARLALTSRQRMKERKGGWKKGGGERR